MSNGNYPASAESRWGKGRSFPHRSRDQSVRDGGRSPSQWWSNDSETEPLPQGSQATAAAPEGPEALLRHFVFAREHSPTSA